MDRGDLLIRWTARVALGLYGVSLVLRAGSCKGRPWWRGARLAWTVGCGIFLLHVLCAFHFAHHWSHAAAYAATARQTAEVVGLDWGGGIYANYVYLLVWVVDVGWWWSAPRSYAARPGAVAWAIQGFLAFMAFNATVVFGSGAVRWGGLAAFLLLAKLGAQRMCRLFHPR